LAKSRSPTSAGRTFFEEHIPGTLHRLKASESFSQTLEKKRKTPQYYAYKKQSMFIPYYSIGM